MKIQHALILLLLLTACGVQPGAPLPRVATTAAPPPTQQVFTAIPTFTEAPKPTTTPLFHLTNDNMTVAYDFTAHLCEAKWVNSVYPQPLPCPGDLNNVGKGYIGLLSGSDQGLDANFPMIQTFPAYDGAGGLFGRYPKFTVSANDVFYTSFTCRSDHQNCEIEFALGYYDANGKYHEDFPVNYYRFGVEPPINYIQPLSSLNGQTVEFVLVVRAMFKSDPTAAWGLWISPRILR